MPGNYQGLALLTKLTFFSLCFAFISGIWFDSLPRENMPNDAYFFLILWLLVAIIFSYYAIYDFVSGWLISVFCLMVGWRIAGIYGVTTFTYPLLISFLLALINFAYCVWQNVKYPTRYKHALSIADWQLVFVRLYIGFDFIPHFTEKLFAGLHPHLSDVSAFVSLGVPHADLLVWLAGLCEFGAAIALALGFMLRIGAIGATLYLLIATYLGHHFSLGFIWASPGGGWEFATMWMILVLSFAFTGIHYFSLDERLEDVLNVPLTIKKMM